jgi:hypothetical protein
MAQPTLILITGYARSGKDTLAEGLVRGASGAYPILRRNYADSLKAAANTFLQEVGILNEFVNFNNEAFKTKHRDILVALGAGARSVNASVFADILVEDCLAFEADQRDGRPPVVIASDWRYANELYVARGRLEELGWRIVTVMVQTPSIEAANQEEGLSIGEIVRNIAPEHTYVFRPQSAYQIHVEGKQLAAKLGI